MQQQWKAIKTEINGEIGLSSRKFHELWPHMLIHYSDEDEYADILRLVVIALLIPTDTSECERLFSLMNDLKTAERSSLGEKLNSLMMWQQRGPSQHLRCDAGDSLIGDSGVVDLLEHTIVAAEN